MSSLRDVAKPRDLRSPPMRLKASSVDGIARSGGGRWIVSRHHWDQRLEVTIWSDGEGKRVDEYVVQKAIDGYSDEWDV